MYTVLSLTRRARAAATAKKGSKRDIISCVDRWAAPPPLYLGRLALRENYYQTSAYRKKQTPLGFRMTWRPITALRGAVLSAFSVSEVI